MALVQDHCPRLRNAVIINRRTIIDNCLVFVIPPEVDSIINMNLMKIFGVSDDARLVVSTGIAISSVTSGGEGVRYRSLLIVNWQFNSIIRGLL